MEHGIKTKPKLVAGTQAKVPVKEAAVFQTTAGELVAEFCPDVGPKTVQKFKNLSKQGIFIDTTFHRIVKGCMTQGDDPLAKAPANEVRFGQGVPGYTIRDEVNPRKHVREVLSIANTGRPNSAGLQFLIFFADAAGLDNKYKAFGKLINGEDVILKMGQTPVGPTSCSENSKPTVRVGIKSIKIVAADSIE